MKNPGAIPKKLKQNKGIESRRDVVEPETKEGIEFGHDAGEPETKWKGSNSSTMPENLKQNERDRIWA